MQFNWITITAPCLQVQQMRFREGKTGGGGAHEDGQGSLEEAVGLLHRFLLGVGGACLGDIVLGLPTEPRGPSCSRKHTEATFSTSGRMLFRGSHQALIHVQRACSLGLLPESALLPLGARTPPPPILAAAAVVYCTQISLVSSLYSSLYNSN